MVESLHVCVYERCGRSFTAPVRLTDLSHRPRSETYYACPYCFSKMDECEHEIVEGLRLGHGSREIPLDDSLRRSTKSAALKETGKEALATNCPHQMGYLKTRSKDEGVPDTCLTCPKILQCMV